LELSSFYKEGLVEAGCDEAGRGCLAGPVFGAAVILPSDYKNSSLNDSKKLTEKVRYQLRQEIERDAIAWAVGVVDHKTIDKINILRASFLSMHRALEQLNPQPKYIIIDGNRFQPYQNIPFTCIIKGDGKYLSIAAASILAKTYRDDFMQEIHHEYQIYGWNENKGYPTEFHRKAVYQYGVSPYHRLTFNHAQQFELQFNK